MYGPRETAQGFKALVALGEDPGLSPSIHRVFITTHTSNSKGSNALF